MELLELIGRRQSCRRYSNRPVPRELIDRCLEAARLAPSACNSQPWSFIVVDREPLRTQVAQAAFTGLYSLNKFCFYAPVLIALVTENSRYAAMLGGHIRGVQYSLIDIGIAGEHLDLQAAELGLGCCWLGWLNDKAVKQALRLPRSTRIDVMFSLGYPADDQIRNKSRRTLSDVRRYAE